MRLSTAAALHQLSSLAHELACIQTVILHHIIAEHHVKHGFVIKDRTYHTDQILGHKLANLEHKVLGGIRHHGKLTTDDGNTIHRTRLADEILCQCLYALGLELLNILLHGVVLLDVFRNHCLQILRIIEESLDSLQDVLCLIQQFLALLACLGLDTANTGSNTALGNDLEEADLTCSLSVDTTTELARRAETNHAHLVAVLLTEEGDGTELLGLVEGHIAVLIQGDILTDHLIHHALYLTDLLVCHLLEVREVEAQGIRAYVRSLLLYMVAEHLLQRIVEQVGCSMVCG